jgi:uncharacterized membrane protein YphA (DoxX/SURF4 family)
MAIGATAMAAGAAPIVTRGSTPTIGAVAVSVIAVGCGILLLIGFLTPGVAIVTALGSAGLTLPGCPALAASLLDAKPATGFLLVMTIAIVLLGPGAFSLDSYLFGRREIVIPHDSRNARS